VGGALAGLLEGPFGAPFTGLLLERRPGWKEAFFSSLGWIGAGMRGGPLPLAVWVGEGVLALWRRGGLWRAASVAVLLLSGILFQGWWLAPLGVVLSRVFPEKRWVGHALAGLGVYGTLGVLAALGGWAAGRLGWDTPSGTPGQEGGTPSVPPGTPGTGSVPGGTPKWDTRSGVGHLWGMDAPVLVYGAALFLREMVKKGVPWG